MQKLEPEKIKLLKASDAVVTNVVVSDIKGFCVGKRQLDILKNVAVWLT